MSATRSRQSFHTPEYNQKKRSRLIRLLVIVLGSLFALLGLFIGLTHWSALRIKTITIEGNHILSAGDIRSVATSVMSGNYFYMIGKDNAAFYPKDALEKVIREKFPRIENLSVELDNYRTIRVTVSERQPFALWCGSTQTAGASSQCYFLDRYGYVFSPAPDFSGDAYFKYYGLVPYESPVGSSYLSSSEKFTELSRFVATVKSLHITPLYLVAKSQDEFELYLYGGGKLIFDDHEPLSKVGEYLAKLLTTESLVPQKNGELLVEYIDLRFGNKLYYKVRGGVR